LLKLGNRLIVTLQIRRGTWEFSGPLFFVEVSSRSLDNI
jgi:hypothetical protein